MTTIGTNPFQQWAATTTGLRQPFPIRSEEVIREALPPHLIPEGFDGKSLPMTYLDSTASTQQSGIARTTIDRLPYANTHSANYPSAEVMTYAYEQAHEAVLAFVGANPKTHRTVFLGSGATTAINRVARNLFMNPSTDRRGTVLFSEMEHHANMLPWKKYAPNTIAVEVNPKTGTLSVDAVKAQLNWRRESVRLVAITLVSNVTGIVNNVAEIARIAHERGIEVLVDAAQGLVHHWGINMQAMGIDYLVASGHKAYVRRSPGVLVMPRNASPQNPDEMGGGIVKFVRLDAYKLAEDREEAGTPNSLGAIGLAANLEALQKIGMQNVWDHELELTRRLLAGLAVFPEVTIYGDTNLARTLRAGVVSFNVENLYHAVVSKALADYFNMPTRNGCFCAQPYVTRLLGVTAEQQAIFEKAVDDGDSSNTPGMVRASLGIYTSAEDIDRSLAVMAWIIKNRKRIREEYYVDSHGSALRRDGWRSIDPKNYSPIQ